MSETQLSSIKIKSALMFNALPLVVIVEAKISYHKQKYRNKG